LRPIKNLLLVSSIFFITSCGGGSGSGSGGGSGGGGTTTPSTPAPTVNLSAEPTSVLLGSAATLTWSSTNSTSCSATWTNATTGSGSEAVTITSAGNNTFSISCTGVGGAGSKSITVEGYRNINGIVVDGYISGAEVFIDEDNDWIADSNESSTTSDTDGTFTIKYANGNLISIGGTDLDSQAPLDNLLIAHKLTAHSDFKAVTPVTSVATFMTDSSNINAALGIDSSIDVFTFDPVANRGDGGINDYLYEKGNQLTALAYALQNIVNSFNSTTEKTQDYFRAITEEIEKEFTETSTKVDIETESFIAKALDNVITAKGVIIADEAEANTAKALSGIMPVIEVKSSTSLTTSVIRFAVSTLQTDIKAIANGAASPATITSYTENILSYIATDQGIDSDQITPDISAIADAATTSEDTAVEINVLANDSFLASAPITVSSANGVHGSTAVLNNLITYTSDADYNGTDTFSYTITQGDKTSSATVSVTIEAVNDAPVATAANYYLNLLPMSQNSGDITLAGTDKEGDTLTYSIVSNGSYGTASLSGSTVSYQTSASTQSAQSESFTFKVNDGTVDSSAATVLIDLRTDPLYQYQWHLNNTGQTNFSSNEGTSGADLNVDTVISSGAYGTGINIGIIDGGIELDHEDLSSNVLANASWDYVDADRNPVPIGNDATAAHGTAIAGITSATAWNNLGGRGIAPGSKFASYNALDTGTFADFIDAVGAGDGSKADNSNIDIYNMSFGAAYPTAYEPVLSGDLLAAFENGINNLRSEKGAIYIKSAGNYYRYLENNADVYCGPNSQLSDLMTCHDSSHNLYGANPYFIMVPAITAKDGAAIYASSGSNSWVSAYGGEYGDTHPAIMTTDLETCTKGSVRTGNASYNAFDNQGNHSENTSCNYTAKMNGSSSAAPVVAGVVALMLEKEPNLTWRDVKHILATTADVIDPNQSVTHSGLVQHDWITNAAGHEFHNWYGFGKVNAQAAINAADSYTIGSLGTLCTISGTTGVINQALSEGTTPSVINISSSSPCGSGVIEFVKVKMYYSHAAPNTVGMRLLSPSNTIANIITPYSKITTNPNEAEFNIGVSSFYGESMTGDWTIAIDDYLNGTTGNLLGWTIEIYGH
jgi:subtilisin family serine protease